MIIDDDPLIRKSLENLFRSNDYRIQLCANGKQGIASLDTFRPNVVLLDLRLGDMDGLQVLREIKHRSEDTQVIMLTAHGSIENTVQAMREGAFDYVPKPFDNHRLKAAVCKGFQCSLPDEANVVHERLQYAERHNVPKIIGKSQELQKVYALIQRVARSEDSTVLIEGESGTGKELLASHVHYLSARFEKPFVKLNCACIPESLAEAELFGYEKGSFTGGLKEGKTGKFKLAEGGTLFLDEIGDLPLGVQTKLLRILEERTYFPIGGTKELQSNVRIVAATNKNLLEQIQKGNFREDLYYRLSTLKVIVPPLRERREDILPLAAFFIGQFCKKLGAKQVTVTAEAESVLLQHPWRGNIRELRNAMERIILLENPRIIHPRHLEFLRENPDSSQVVERLLPDSLFSRGITYDEMVKSLVKAAMSETHGNQVGAARLLGISRAKLRYQIGKYGLKF